MMTSREMMKAYAAIADDFNLTHQQRTALDNSADYATILWYAHKLRWNIVEMFLKDNGIIAA